MLNKNKNGQWVVTDLQLYLLTIAIVGPLLASGLAYLIAQVVFFLVGILYD